MRVPRLRFTIGGLMALVLFASLVLWVRVQVIARLSPSIPEQAALAAYQQSKLTREVAEVAVVEYTEGLYKQDLSDGSVVHYQLSSPEFKGDMPIIRWNGDRLPRSNPTPDREPVAIAKQSTRAKLIQDLRAEVVSAKADEASKLATYNRERAKRLRLFGIW